MRGLLIKNGLLSDNNSYTKKDILIENGKISRIDEKIDCDDKNTEVIDIHEAYVYPGLIDCHTHVGIIEEATGKIGVDNNETSNPVTPQLRVIDGINPLDIAFTDAVTTGITSIMCTPGSDNAVGGLNAVIKTFGTIIDKMIVKYPLGLKIALGENPLSTYGKNSKCPVTRMGSASLIRELFMKTQDYMTQKENGKLEKRDIGCEAVVPLLKNEIFLRVHAHRADDIVTAIRIADEFNIKKLVIEHGTEAHLIKDYLREKKVPVAFGPMLTPRIKMEMKRRSYGSVCELVESGVKVALITDHPYNSIDQLRTVAILAVSEGLSKNDGLKCITGNPADIMGCEDRIGSLKVGCDGDIAIFSGDIFDINSKVQMTILDGNVVFKRK